MPTGRSPRVCRDTKGLTRRTNCVYDVDMETNESLTAAIKAVRPEAPAHIREETWAWEAGFDAGFRAAAAMTFDQAIDAAPPADDKLRSLMTEPVVVDVIDQ